LGAKLGIKRGVGLDDAANTELDGVYTRLEPGKMATRRRELEVA
jgi:hypothetical protein